ncbi:MAG: TRAP transporter substrate-binding protein [Pseudomonadales bacterium]
MLTSVLTWCLLSLAMVTASASAETITQWDLPTAYPSTNYHTVNTSAFAADVERASAGRLKITLHPGASLYRGNEIKRAVQGGQVEIGEFLLSAHANESPLFGVDSIPFLATRFDTAARLWQAARPAVANVLAQQGLTLLHAVPWPPQGIFSRRPINALADLRGTRLRVYSPATARFAALAGAQAVNIQAAELAQALATGTVEANLTSGATGYDARIWEVVPYFYDVRAWLPLNVTVVNTRALEGLDAETQTAIRTAAMTAETRGWEVAEERSSFFTDELVRNGMQVQVPDPTFSAELERVGAILADEWREDAGAAGANILATFRSDDSTCAASSCN